MRGFGLALIAVLTTTALCAEAEPTPPAEEATDQADFLPQIAREAAAEGNAAFALKDYPRARLAYRKMLELVPDNLTGLVNLGVMEFYSGNFADAERYLKRALAVRADTAPAWLTLGIMAMEQGRLDEALAALAQAALYDPRDARIRNYFGVVLGRKEWIDGAQDELRKAVALDSDYADAHYNLAMSYLENDPPSIELARRHYFRAVELGAAADPEVEAILKAAPAPTGESPE